MKARISSRYSDSNSIRSEESSALRFVLRQIRPQPDKLSQKLGTELVMIRSSESINASVLHDLPPYMLEVSFMTAPKSSASKRSRANRGITATDGRRGALLDRREDSNRLAPLCLSRP